MNTIITADVLRKVEENTPSWKEVEQLRKKINEDGVGVAEYERAYDKANAFDLLFINTLKQQVYPICQQLTKAEQETLLQQLNGIVKKINKPAPQSYDKYLNKSIEKLRDFEKKMKRMHLKNSFLIKTWNID